MSGGRHRAPTRHLIVPGLGKAGTTFLFQNLIRQPDIFGSAGTKEINFFGEAAVGVRSAYLARFPTDDHRKILLDASLSYIQNRDDSADRIRSVLAADEVTIVILVRDPIETFFSHYLHELKSTIGRPSWRREHRPAAFRLDDPAVMARYMRPRSPAVARFSEVFGASCLGFHMGSLFDDTLRAKLGTALDVTLNIFDGSEVINRGGFVPRYLYGGNRGLVLEQDGRPFRVPPRALVFVAEERSEIQAYATPEQAAAFQRLAESFTREIELDHARLQALLDDHVKVCAALKLPPLRRSVEDSIRLAAPEARLSRRILDRLPVL